MLLLNTHVSGKGTVTGLGVLLSRINSPCCRVGLAIWEKRIFRDDFDLKTASVVVRFDRNALFLCVFSRRVFDAEFFCTNSVVSRVLYFAFEVVLYICATPRPEKGGSN